MSGKPSSNHVFCQIKIILAVFVEGHLLTIFVKSSWIQRYFEEVYVIIHEGTQRKLVTPTGGNIFDGSLSL